MTPGQWADKVIHCTGAPFCTEDPEIHDEACLRYRVDRKLVADAFREAVQVATSGACGCAWGDGAGLINICDYHFDLTMEVQNLKARLQNANAD